MAGRFICLTTVAVVVLLGYLFRESIFREGIHLHELLPPAVLFGACLFMIFLPQRPGAGRSWLPALAFIILMPAYAFFTGEVVSSVEEAGQSQIRNLVGTAFLTPEKFAINYLILALWVLLLTGLLASLRYGPFAACVSYGCFCIANLYVQTFRGIAMTAADFANLGTGADVAGEYQLFWNFRIYLAVWLMLLAWLSQRRLKKHWLANGPLRRLLLAGGTALAGIILVKSLILSPFLADHGIGVSYFNTMRSYRASGTAAVLARSIRDAVPQKPEGYSAERARQIASRYPSDKAGELAAVPTNDQPNVLVVLDESFTDLRLIGAFKTKGKAMPFLDSLEENCVRGVTYASVRGGMTANTEFEFLTGNTMGFLTAGAVPFQIYIKNELPSLAIRMGQEGYDGLSAFHPYNPKNYSRDKVYPLLGFRNFYSNQNLPIPLEDLRIYPSDASDFQNVISFYEGIRKGTAAPWFFYNMTVQNHSPYDLNFDDFEHPVTLKKWEDKYPEVNQYLSLVRASDDAFRGLVEYFETISEPTVILFMGDHQPKIPSGFVKRIRSKEYTVQGVERRMDLYQVPFVIWANFDIPEDYVEKTSMNYMQVLLAKAYGGKLTGYQKFLQELSGEVVAINAFGYWGADGAFYDVEDTASPYYEKICEYRILQYNYLFDRKNRIEGFFELAGQSEA